MPNQYSVKRIPNVVIGPSIAYVPLTDGLFACIDSEDVPLVSHVSWSAIKTNRHSTTHYAVGKPRGDGKHVYLHRFLSDTTKDVDHRNINGLDCRRDNLRPATEGQNAANRDVQANSQSGYKGVSRCSKCKNKWIASVKFGSVRIRKRFDSLEEAVSARERYASELHGEFSR